MKTPMTTKQAQKEHQCSACKAGLDCPSLLFRSNCVEDSTCSIECTECSSRIWFEGKRNEAPRILVCPYCAKITINKYSEKVA